MIELLVVIGILALLGAALMTGLGESQQQAYRGIDKILLQRRYGQFLIAHQQGVRLPAEGGCKFVYYPWVSGTIERTPENLAAHFVSDSISPRLAEMLESGAHRALTSYDQITSGHTDFAGRAEAYYARSMFQSGNEPLLATDNEHGNTYRDGTVLVLYGNGAVRTIHREQVPEAAGDPDYVIEVGPDSPVADLRKLAR